jgi:hypothetical protein
MITVGACNSATKLSATVATRQKGERRADGPGYRVGRKAEVHALTAMSLRASKP